MDGMGTGGLGAAVMADLGQPDNPFDKFLGLFLALLAMYLGAMAKAGGASEIWQLLGSSSTLFDGADYAACFICAYIAGGDVYRHVIRSRTRVAACALAIILGWVTSNCGGGVWRDSLVLLQPFFVRFPEYAVIAGAGAALGTVLHGHYQLLPEATARVLDNLATAIFCIIGTRYALMIDLGPIAELAKSGGTPDALLAAVSDPVVQARLIPHAFLFSLCSACFGGLIRDVVLQRPPQAFMATTWLICAAAGPLHLFCQYQVLNVHCLAYLQPWCWVLTTYCVVSLLERTRTWRLDLQTASYRVGA
jgi:uncharacterized membrane protein YeiH